jgi:hypothetical protein
LKHVLQNFFALKKISECVFRIFSKFELKRLRKIHSEVFVQGQKWKNRE